MPQHQGRHVARAVSSLVVSHMGDPVRLADSAAASPAWIGLRRDRAGDARPRVTVHACVCVCVGERSEREARRER